MARNYVRRWDSMSAFVEYVSKSSAMRHEASRTPRGRMSFHSCETFDEAKAVAFNWPQGVDRIEGIRARIGMSNQRVRKEVVAREAGPGVLSMGHFLAGHPQPYMCLEDSKRVAKGRGKVVSILLNCSVNASVTREQIETRGAAVLALAAALEQAGRRVEISVGDCSAVGYRSASLMDYRVKVKAAQARLNLNSVAFALANPDMLRRFIFAAEEIDGFTDEYGYGTPRRFPNVPEGTIVIEGGVALWDDVEKAAAWVRGELEAQGVIIK